MISAVIFTLILTFTKLYCYGLSRDILRFCWDVWKSKFLFYFNLYPRILLYSFQYYNFLSFFFMDLYFSSCYFWVLQCYFELIRQYSSYSHSSSYFLTNIAPSDMNLLTSYSNLQYNCCQLFVFLLQNHLGYLFIRFLIVLS